MPEEAVTAPVPEASAPVSPNNDAPPNANGPAPPGPGESFVEKMERLGGFDSPEDAPSETTEAPSEEPKPKVDKGKEPASEPKTKTVEADPGAAKKEAARVALAELGIEFDDAKVGYGERAEFREAKRKANAAIEKQRTDALAEIAAAQTAASEKLGKVDAILAAWDAGDPDGFAKALGKKDWNEAQQHFLEHLKDPRFKEIVELRNRLDAKEQAEARAREEAAAAAANAQRQQEMASYRQGLSVSMAKAQEPLMSSMADVPIFVNSVLEVQQDLWQRSGGDPAAITLDKVLDHPVQGRTLRNEMKALYDKLAPVFATKEEPAEAEPGKAKKPVSKSAAVAPSKAATEAAPRRDETFQEFLSRGSRMLQDAAREEDRQLANGKRT